MDTSTLSHIPTNELRDLRDTAERVAERFVRRGDTRSASRVWACARVYSAVIERRAGRR